MSDASFTTRKCAECGQPLSMEVGITNYGPEGNSKLYCTPCAPNSGRGYTLADIRRWREDGQAERAKYAKYELSVMDRVVPDTYISPRGRQLEPWARLEEFKRRIRRTLRDLGVGE